MPTHVPLEIQMFVTKLKREEYERERAGSQVKRIQGKKRAGAMAWCTGQLNGWNELKIRTISLARHCPDRVRKYVSRWSSWVDYYLRT